MKIILFCLLLLTSCTIGFRPVNSIRIDGIINKNEWKGAQEYQLRGGNKLLMLSDNDLLHIAVISGKGFWTHLYLSDGEVVRIMHASAALAAVEYKRNNAVWLTLNSFHYELRDSVYNRATITRMSKYFANNGWVANNNNLGKGNAMEFRINLNGWNRPLYFACVVAKNDMSLYPFPLNLSDDAVLPNLVRGNSPDSLHFNPTTWERIK